MLMPCPTPVGRCDLKMPPLAPIRRVLPAGMLRVRTAASGKSRELRSVTPGLTVALPELALQRTLALGSLVMVGAPVTSVKPLVIARMLPLPSFCAQVAVSPVPTVIHPPMMPLTLGMEAFAAERLPAVGRVRLSAPPELRVRLPSERLTEAAPFWLTR